MNFIRIIFQNELKINLLPKMDLSICKPNNQDFAIIFYCEILLVKIRKIFPIPNYSHLSLRIPWTKMGIGLYDDIV